MPDTLTAGPRDGKLAQTHRSKTAAPPRALNAAQRLPPDPQAMIKAIQTIVTAVEKALQ